MSRSLFKKSIEILLNCRVVISLSLRKYHYRHYILVLLLLWWGHILLALDKWVAELHDQQCVLLFTLSGPFYRISKNEENALKKFKILLYKKNILINITMDICVNIVKSMVCWSKVSIQLTIIRSDQGVVVWSFRLIALVIVSRNHFSF